MPCIKPIMALKRGEGRPYMGKELAVHRDKWGHGPNELWLACGLCINCRMRRRRDWAVRSMHERQWNTEACFLTLTYDNRSLPRRFFKDDGSEAWIDQGWLDKTDFQKFMKRVRHHRGKEKQRREPLKVLWCGEYGEKTKRPHFHALIFGEDFASTMNWRSQANGYYTSEEVEYLWPHGNHYVGGVEFGSASYVASYAVKKLSGAARERENPSTGLAEYDRLDSRTGEVVRVPPVCNHASNNNSGNGSLGQRWFEQYWADVYPEDEVTLKGGIKLNPPKAYDRWLEERDPAMHAEVKDARRAHVRGNSDYSERALHVAERLATIKWKNIVEKETI